MEYKKGHHALEIFDGKMEGTPRWVKIWIVFATAWFAIGLFFIWHHSIARWIVGCYVAGFLSLVFSSIFDSVLFKLSGFNALMHVVFWSPALYLLLTERPFLATEMTPFSIWSGGVTAVMLFSFFFDIRYSIEYLKHVFVEK